MSEVARYLGFVLAGMTSVIGIRFLLYFHSFLLHWPRYRQRREVTTEQLAQLPELPFVKIQITTRGSPGTSEVVARGMRNLAALAQEDPGLYCPKLIVEVVTEDEDQRELLEEELRTYPAISGCVVAVPRDYETPRGTQLKARALHYIVERRREGLNRKPGRTFVVHFDEESVMEPDELRKLIHYLATTNKKLTEGPIYYPLEYEGVDWLCRAMEANRPIGCYECRSVMERGIPLHLHGSNLVIEEELENELGWDIGTLDGEPFIAEDFVFGVLAYLKEGSDVFGWHGCVVLEQPPFSFKSAFRQRYRWIFGVLQGLTMLRRMPQFAELPRSVRRHLIRGTQFRILTFMLGLPTGIVAFIWLVYQLWLAIAGVGLALLPFPIMLWLVVCAFLWLNSVVIGLWYNIHYSAQLTHLERWREAFRAILLAPIAGVLESTAGFWAVLNWASGRRTVNWVPTPKTKEADRLATSG